ncbi:MAG: hypothetical protein WBW93_09635 [Steroidobacteraceae bacterium]
MKRLTSFVAAGLSAVSLTMAAPAAHAAMHVSRAIAAAVADPHRPAADRARDAERKPAACVAFAAVHPGETIAELFPGTGYFTRICSRVVGPKGHVYEYQPKPRKPGAPAPVKAIAGDPHYYHNITVITWPVGKLPVPRPVDLVWTSPAGSGFSDTHTLHRIDPEAAKKEIMSAGFEFVGQSDVLRNPEDSHTKIVFDPSIRGHTDQFIYKFRKPG